MKRTFLTYCFLAFSCIGVSQTNDAGFWLGFTLDLDLKKKYHAGLDVQSRWNENISEAKTNFIEPWASKDWTDRFSTTLSYRIISRRNLENIYNGRDRISLDFKYKTKIKSVKIQYRLRTQRRLGIVDFEQARNADFVMRHRIKFGYKLNKRWNCSILGEPYFSRESTGEWSLTNLRFRANLDFKVKKRNYLSLGYLIQQEQSTRNPLTEYNMIIGYTIILK